jgi:predicted MFS family arabinose efflux permease
MVGGVSRMLGPMWAGVAFQHVGIRSPFWIAGALMAATFLFSSVVRTDDDAADPAAAVIPDAPS